MIKLKFLHYDRFDCPVYQDQKKRLWKSAEPCNDRDCRENCMKRGDRLCRAAGDDVDGDPDYPIPQNEEVVFIGPVDPRPSEELRRRYMLLGRLRSDCEYYCNRSRHPKHLWAGNEQGQIDKMRELYDSFSDDEKPEWLTAEQIDEYERWMLPTEDLKGENKECEREAE